MPDVMAVTCQSGGSDDATAIPNFPQDTAQCWSKKSAMPPHHLHHPSRPCLGSLPLQLHSARLSIGSPTEHLIFPFFSPFSRFRRRGWRRLIRVGVRCGTASDITAAPQQKTARHGWRMLSGCCLSRLTSNKSDTISPSTNRAGCRCSHRHPAVA